MPALIPSQPEIEIPSAEPQPLNVQKTLNSLQECAIVIEKYIQLGTDELNVKRVQSNVDFINQSLAYPEVDSALINPNRTTVLTALTNGQNFLNNL